MKRAIKASYDDAVTLNVIYEVHGRAGSGGLKRAVVHAPTLIDALKKLVDRMGLYINSEMIERKNMTPEEVIERIKESNGDGCDYIIQLNNLSTREVLVQGEDFSEEEW